MARIRRNTAGCQSSIPRSRSSKRARNQSMKRYYSIVAPKTIRADSKYNVTVSLHVSNTPCTFKISLKGPGLKLSQKIQLQPMSSGTLVFQIPMIKLEHPNFCEYSKYAIEAKGVSGIIFTKSADLHINQKKLSIFVQTDKAIYKPGDIVRYRIIAIDRNTRPVKFNENVDIFINDGQQNLIKKVSNATFISGVHSGELELSKFPVLGDWGIRVEVNGDMLKSTNFDVAKYVLPKFKVSVDAPSVVFLLYGRFTITVHAKYTYGQPLKGKATVSLTNYYSDYNKTDLDLDCTKIANIDGSVDIEIDLAKDLHLSKYTEGCLPVVKVQVKVTEEHSGLSRDASCQVTFNKTQYIIEPIDMPQWYHPDKSLQLNCLVKHITGRRIISAYKTAILTVLHRCSVLDCQQSNLVFTIESHVNKKGIATFNIFFPTGCNSPYALKAKYGDDEFKIGNLFSYNETIQDNETIEEKNFMVKVLNKRPTLNKDIQIKVVSKTPLNSFVYNVLAGDNILSSGFIKVPKDKTEHIFGITPDYRMVPLVTVLIIRIHEEDYPIEKVYISFDYQLENKIIIDAPPEAKPGDDVTLQVKTSPDSYVGLMAVDQSVLLLKSGNDLNIQNIFYDLNEYNGASRIFRATREEDGIIFTNAPQYNSSSSRTKYYASFRGGGGGYFRSEIKIREQFPETWIWADINSKQDGIATLQTKVPDTLTSWILTGFSMSDKLGLSLTNEANKLRVFQPFFVSTNLPYSVKRDEEISVPVMVFNYTENPLKSVVILENFNNEFEFVDEPRLATQNVNIPPNESRVAYFRIRPTKIGQIALKIVATTPIAGDGINQMLRVEPEGVTEYVNKAVWVDLRVQQYQQDEIDIEIPDDIVAGSEYIEVSIIGDILGPTIKNLDKLVQMPCGCGEQNMINFVPNILVLQYLTSTGQLSEAIEAKAEKFMAVGYQRELTYKHEDGSYSSFGMSDKSGSTWLTAYVARSFHQAVKYIEIDERVLESALSFLAKTQAESGEFSEVGKLIDFKHSNGEGKGVALTAFVVLAFLENTELLSKFNGVVSKALTFLAENIPATGDLYALSIAAFALQSGKHDGAKKAVEKLKSLATQDGDRKWWSQPIAKSSKKHCWWQPRSVDVEITSYALMAIMQRDDAESALPIIKWLIAQRNSNGGFASTQDTVVGLQALIAFAEKTRCGKPAIEIGFADDLDNATGLSVNEENALVLHSHVLSKAARHVTIISEGAGSALAQVSYRYNIDKADKKPSFTVRLRPTVQSSARSDILLLDVLAAYNPTDSNKESNMAVMEVNLPSGFTADVDCFVKLEEIERVKRIDTKNDNSVVIIYFDSLAQDEVCCRVVATKSHEVSNQRPSAVVVFDYYDNNQRAKEFYELA